MEPISTLDLAVIEALHKRITKLLPLQVRSCIQALDDEQIWWRPNDKTNSVGNLVLHLSGSIRHNLSHIVGGKDYRRDRPAEFAERGPVSKDKLLSIFDETIKQAAETLDSFDTARFLEATKEPGYPTTLFDQILGVAVHLGVHTGQIVYVTKMLKEGSIDELWISALKAQANT